jgi:xylan 1,4-beta-xylosidase
MYSSYTAASFARKLALADRFGVNLDGALTWAFQFEGKPYFAGFRSLATNGVDKPVLNVFRMFSRMGGRELPAASSHAVPLDVMLRNGVRDEPDVAALATLAETRLCAMIWHYHDDDVAGVPAAVELRITGLPAAAAAARLEHYRIDDEHSNAFSLWKRLGSPQDPSPEQYARLEAAGRLARLGDPAPVAVTEGATMLSFGLPRQAVSLIVLDWSPPTPADTEETDTDDTEPGKGGEEDIPEADNEEDTGDDTEDTSLAERDDGESDDSDEDGKPES